MKSLMVVAMVFVVGCSAEEVPLDDDVESNTSASVVVDEDMKKLAQCNQDCIESYTGAAIACEEAHSWPCESPRGCMTHEDYEACNTDLWECQDWCRSYPWQTNDMWNIRRAMRQACYHDCDEMYDSCSHTPGNGGGSAPGSGTWNPNAADCQASYSQCNRGCACTFGGPNLGSCG